MAIRMRRGLEADYDPSKMVPGEWAVSTDKHYVRMCFEPGITLRMATYEAFEADMAKIQKILAECKDIQTAITRIQSEVNSKAVLCAEYAESAKASADAAAESAEQAKIYAENASAIAGVQIATKEIAGLMRGGENYVDESGALVLTARTDSGVLKHSHEGGVKLHSISAVDDRQESTTGAQLFDAKSMLLANADSISVNGDTITVVGYKAYAQSMYQLKNVDMFVGKSITFSCDNFSKSVSSANITIQLQVTVDGKHTYHDIIYVENPTKTVEIPENATYLALKIVVNNSATALETANTVTVKGLMLNIGTEALPWEPYTGGKPSPAPGEAIVTSTNQLKLNGTTQTMNGVTATFDMSNQFVYIVGEPTADAAFTIGTAKLEAGTYYANVLLVSPSEMNSVYDFAVTDADGIPLVEASGQTANITEQAAFTLTEAQTVTFGFKVPSGESIDNEFQFGITSSADADWDAYTVEYTEGYPQEIEGTVLWKNLLENTAVDTTKYGIEFTVNAADKSVSINGTTTDNAAILEIGTIELDAGTYILSGGLSDTCKMVLRKDSISGSTITDTTGSKAFTLTEKTTVSAGIRVSSGSTINSIVYPMIRPAEILDDTYVPYGMMRVYGVGKNLYNKELYPFTEGYAIASDGGHYQPQSGNWYATIKYIPFSGHDGETITYADKSGSLIAFYDKNKNVLLTKSGTSATVPSGTAFIRFDCHKDYVDIVQIELGAERTSYEPYTSQSILIPIPQKELHAIGGVSDAITSEAIVKRFETVVFDGSVDETWSINGSNQGYKIVVNNMGGSDLSTSFNNILCDTLIVARQRDIFNGTNDNIIASLGYPTNALYIRFDSDVTSLDLLRERLAAHPITVVYELAEEEIAPLPVESQIALHSLKSYPSVTRLYTDTYPPMVIDCEYGTSRAGAVAFEGYNAGRKAEIRAEANYKELAAALLALSQE